MDEALADPALSTAMQYMVFAALALAFLVNFGRASYARLGSVYRSAGSVLAFMLLVGSYGGGIAGCSGGSGMSADTDLTPQEGVIYYLDDHLGSVHLIVDSLGNAIHEVNRYPYGLEKSATSSDEEPFDLDYAYTGKELDSETGLIYFGKRYYAPEMGRFLQRDPKWYVDGMNVYAYVGGNPIRWIDPFGLNKVDTDLQGYTDKDFGKAFEAAGIVIDASNVTVTSLRALSLSSKALISASAAVTAAGSLYSAYGLIP